MNVELFFLWRLFLSFLFSLWFMLNVCIISSSGFTTSFFYIRDSSRNIQIKKLPVLFQINIWKLRGATCNLTHFKPMSLSIPPENVFKGYRKGTLAWNGLYRCPQWVSTTTEKTSIQDLNTFCASYSRKTLTGRFNVFPPCRIGLKYGDLYKRSLETLKIAIG